LQAKSFTKKCGEKINAVKNSPASPTKGKNKIRVNLRPKLSR